MTAYEYDNLPANFDVQPIPDELFAVGYDAIKQAVESDQSLARELRVAYLYDRKCEMSFDQFGTQRNASYGSESDDVLLQLTVRIPNSNPKFWGGTGGFELVHELETNVIELAKDKRRAKLEAEIAEAEARATAAANIADQKRAELSNLNGN